jgi:EpsI family protein
MSRLPLLLVVGVLAAGGVQVHRVRSRLSARDADPAAVERLKAGLDAIPLDLAAGRYVGKEEPLSERIVRMSGADLHVSREYRSPAGDVFRLYVGGAIANDENFHPPSYCMPAAGWEVLEEGTAPFTAYPTSDSGDRMRRLVLQHGRERMLVYYWFQAGERFADHEWTVRFWRFVDLLRGAPLRPTIILTLYAPVSLDVATTESAAQQFLRTAGSYLHEAVSQ